MAVAIHRPFYNMPTAAVGIGTQVVTDAFNRANESPIGGVWTDSTAASESTDMVISSNHAQPATFNAGDSSAFLNTWASGDDQYSQAALTSVGTSAGAGGGVVVRRSSTAATATMYRLVIDAGGNFELLKFVAGSNSSLRTGTVSYVATTKLGLSVSGSATTTLKIWYGGVQVGTNITDASSPITTGLPGIAYSSAITSTIIDDWDAGTVP